MAALGKPDAGDDDAVQRIAAGEEAGRGIDRRSERRIVVLRAEEGLVAPERVVRHHDAVANAVLEHELRVDAPLVLAKALEHVAAEESVGALPDLAVGVEETERAYWPRQPSMLAAAAAGIGEDKQAVLIVGRAGARVVDADLVVVVLAGVLPQSAELESVIAPNLGESIAEVVDHAAGA